MSLSSKPYLYRHGWKPFVALAGIAAAMLLWAPFLNTGVLLEWVAAPSPREVFLAAVGTVRPSEGRLVGFPHAAFSELERSKISDELLRAKKKIEKNAEEGTPDGLADLAVLRLLDGRPAEAVLLLEESIQRAPFDARHWSDLSASYYARAHMRGQPWDIILGLAASEEALALDPKLAEAIFNRALGLEKIHLSSRALESWVAAHYGESDPAWRGEIQEHISAAKRRSESELWDRWRSRLRVSALKGDQGAVDAITQRFSEAARDWVEEDLLADWAEAQEKGQEAEADRYLAVARAVGDALAKMGGDSMAQDAVAVIEHASPERRRYLINGHRAYGRAVRLYPGDLRGTLAEMRGAYLSLTRGRSPFAAWAKFWTALCAYQLSSFPEAVATLEALQRSPIVATHAALQGRVEWMLGLVAFNRADFFGAVRAYSRALKIFDDLGELQNLASVQCRLSLVLAVLGDAERAWKLQAQSLDALDRFRDPWRIGALLEVAAFQVLHSGQPRVALVFQDEYVRLATDQGDAVTASAALQQRAETLLSIGRVEDARKNLRQAQEWMERISSLSVREVIQGDLAFKEGVVLTRIDPAQAVEYLSEALQSYLRSDYRALVVQLYLQRAIARLQIGQAEAAEIDLMAGLAELERVRSAIDSQALRASYFELARPVFEEMVKYQVRRGQCGSAFKVWERSRARILVEARREGNASPATVESVRRALPLSAGLVEYAALDDRLVIWLLRRDRVVCKCIPISARMLASLVGQHREALFSGLVESRGVAVRLYDVLLGPIAQGIADLRSLVIVPDRELHLVPFAALSDGKSGRYIVEALAVSIAPSAGVWLRRPEGHAKALVSVLSLGDPAFNTESFPALSRLKGAKKEAMDIAALYPIRELWLGKDATRTRLLHGLATADVVHVAAHALPGSPEAPPYLLLAPEPREGGSAALSLDILSTFETFRAQVVVLSACATGAGPLSKMEGSISLARPFLAAGIPSVVVSLWPVEDQNTRDLLVDFHHGVRAGARADEALRQAQLRSLANSERSTNSLRKWAAFVVLGSN